MSKLDELEDAAMRERDGAEIARLERALKLQRNAALTLADASAAVSGARLEQARKLFAESRPESVESERAMNAILTADVERLERERDELDGTVRLLSTVQTTLLTERDAARAEVEALRTALAMMYDKWVDGDDCYEEPDTFSGFLGKAFQLSITEEDHVISLIGKDCHTRAIDAAIAKEQKP
jgi:hypothetical protein